MPPLSTRGRARIGVVTPFTNTNLEADLALLRPVGVSCHIARAGGYDIDAVPDSEKMRQFALAGLDTVLESLCAARPDIILYGCTSATLSMSPAYDREFCERIEAQAGVPALTAAGAIVEALDDLDIRTIGFCSPYTEELNREAAAFLGETGRQVIQSAYIGKDLGNYGQSELPPDQVLTLGKQADHPQAQAIVLSCTDMRSVEVIDDLEAATGKPVITSNQAMMYCAIKRLGLPDRVPGRLGSVGHAKAQAASAAR
ncbi:MAG: Asp/Glu racemase [Rhodospirillaceae bacterium]|jgi:maleate isomerase|nr:Asp/Glu racemase [Rhodospirillaceae bacterium]MBT6202983.1 Asp/Glu racemase [Rhodospirillaceae bacterium]MBT6512864.1 Asp/Glu racemase [Rhodospirillaceae bacterium]MBT7646793.1 Asp/Glu racemase [Rhodospirillaceae bacterium]